MPNVRIATIGSSAIVDRFLDAVANTPGAEYVAAYSRDLARARAFGEPYGARLFFDDLAALAACDEVDAVYIATPIGIHAVQAKAMIAAGKHVFVEKAFASNKREGAEVFDLARAHGVVCMEAIRNLYTEGFANIRRMLPECGQIRFGTFRFGKVTSRIKRFEAGEYVAQFDPALAEGALMDIGVYSVEPAVALFGVPKAIHAVGVTTKVSWDAPAGLDTIDLFGNALLDYGDKVVDLAFGKLADDVVECQVAGGGGTVHWGEPGCPRDITFNRHEDKGMIYGHIAGASEVIASHDPDNDMICELTVFINAVRGEKDALSRVAAAAQVTVDSLGVMDEIRRQMGVTFPADLPADSE